MMRESLRISPFTEQQREQVVKELMKIADEVVQVTSMSSPVQAYVCNPERDGAARSRDWCCWLACGSEQPAQRPPPPPEVAVQTVDPRPVPLDLTYTARTVGSREVEVRARVGGILLKRRFEEGSRVRQGQPMFQIDPEPVRARVASARAEVAVAKARLDEARRQRDRVLPLFEQNAVSQSRRDEAVSAFEVAQANLAAAESSLRMARARSRVHRRARADLRADQPRGDVRRQPRVDRSELEPADEDRAGRSAVRRVRGARSGSHADPQRADGAADKRRGAEREAAARRRHGISGKRQGDVRRQRGRRPVRAPCACAPCCAIRRRS